MLLQKLRDEAHVWVISPESLKNSVVLEACLGMISDQEHERYSRFRFAEDRHRYLVSHALVRTVLSKYARISPDAWVFAESEYGKPFISNPGFSAIRFNLSHTDGLAACILALGCDCGIDVEKVHDRHSLIDVAERMFSGEEVEQMRQLKGREQLEYFFLHWTLREAYVKAQGLGISFPTRNLNFKIKPSGEVDIEFLTEIEQKPEDWQLKILTMTDDHVAAAAVCRPDQADKAIVQYQLKDYMWAYDIGK